jgi:8-oxo-dGTP pyrophosphatase MutT (NUDIX family)
MKSDPYVRVRKRVLYRNPWLAVEAHDIVHPNGEPGEHVLVVAPQPSAIVVEDGGDLLFARQPRFGARRNVIEIVKGGCNPGESALECAQRELLEELGIVAESWAGLGILYEIPSVVSDPLALFLAGNVHHEESRPEPNESIELVRMKVADAIAAVLGGEIDDAVTIAALFRYGLRRGIISCA